MPKPVTAEKTTTQSSSAPPPTAEGLVYPDLKVLKKWGDSAVTAAEAVEFLQLETEEDYARRVAKESGLDATNVEKLGIKLKNWTFVIPKDHVGAGLKVICWACTHNRPFDLGVALCHEQDILTRNWAGPTTMPEETINGETVILGRDGQVLSGQKRLVGLWLAKREWEANPEKWGHLWPSEPVMDTLMVVGVSNHPRIVQTLDNVQPRTEADTFYTTGAAGKIFGKAEDALPQKQKAEGCRMLQAALDFAWKRTGMDDRMQKTNRAAQDWLDAHPKLYRAVKHIWDENRPEVGRRLSVLRLSAGQAAAAMVLMAASKTEPDGWRAAQMPSEKELDLSLWAKAEEFWTRLAAKDGHFKVLADALVKLITPEEEGLGGRAAEKFCLIALAWRKWLEGAKFTPELLRLQYAEDRNGAVVISDPPDFGGIDNGPSFAPPAEDDPEVTEAEVEARKEEVRQEAAKQTKAAPKPPAAAPAPKPAQSAPKPVTNGKPEAKKPVPAKPPAKPAPKKPAAAAAK